VLVHAVHELDKARAVLKYLRPNTSTPRPVEHATTDHVKIQVSDGQNIATKVRPARRLEFAFELSKTLRKNAVV
jgi:hypothetical protein